jgi:hypothetical protein
MSVARRDLKTIEELREWIEGHTSSAGVPDEEGTPLYAIVRRAPTCGAADWNVMGPRRDGGSRRRWSSARRHAIQTARLLFDVR